MRVAAQVMLGYVLVLLLGALYPSLPFVERAAPDVVALCAVYLGLTAHTRLAPSMFGAVVLGYLADLMVGSPRGVLALTAGIICIMGHVAHRGLIVRGWTVTLVFSFFVGLAAGLVVMALRAYLGLGGGGFGSELWLLLGSSILTSLTGPLVLRLCRIVDARFARTYRERDATLEGFGR